MEERFLKVLARLGVYWKPDKVPFNIVQAAAKWKSGVKRYNLAKNQQQQVDALKWLHKVIEKADEIPTDIKKHIRQVVIVRMPKRPKKR